MNSVRLPKDPVTASSRSVSVRLHLSQDLGAGTGRTLCYALFLPSLPHHAPVGITISLVSACSVTFSDSDFSFFHLLLLPLPLPLPLLPTYNSTPTYILLNPQPSWFVISDPQPQNYSYYSYCSTQYHRFHIYQQAK